KRRSAKSSPGTGPELRGRRVTTSSAHRHSIQVITDGVTDGKISASRLFAARGFLMSTQLLRLRSRPIRPPADARTFEGFRRWMRSPQCPQWGRFAFLDETVLADMSPEELETHNKIKAEVSRVISNLSRALGNGTFYVDGTLLTNPRARLSTEPDG